MHVKENLWGGMFCFLCLFLSTKIYISHLLKQLKTEQAQVVGESLVLLLMLY